MTSVVDVASAPAPQGAAFPFPRDRSAIASQVWDRFGNVHTYVEPFGGSLAVLLGRPVSHQWWGRREVAGDPSGLVVNFFRAVSADPEGVAESAVWPVSDVEVSARSRWVTGRQKDLTRRLLQDPDFCDVQMAGWWVWSVTASAQSGVSRGRDGAVVGGGATVREAHTADVRAMFTTLAQRLHFVRFAAGGWDRVAASAGEPVAGEVTGVFLDPPLGLARDRVRDWALSEGSLPRARVAFCVAGDREGAVFASAGWSHASDDVWFSPHCVHPHGDVLFDHITGEGSR